MLTETQLQPTKNTDPNHLLDPAQFVLVTAPISANVIPREVERQLVAFKPLLHFAWRFGGIEKR